MAFIPSPRPSATPSPYLSPLSPATPISPNSPSQNYYNGRPPLQQRKSSTQTVTTVTGRGNNHPSRQNTTYSTYAASTISGPAGRRQNSGQGGRRPSQYTRGGMNSNAVGKDQWLHMDPDEIFKRLNVQEVRKVENMLRSSASGKQGELRNMVSERYRDLLLSTSQISQIHDNSLRLSSTLDRIEKLCSTPPTSQPNQKQEHSPRSDDGGLIMGGKNKKKSLGSGLEQEREGDEGGVTRQLPLAASVKLLLDAPETLYSHISAGQYLEAAFLWLLTRLIREELVNAANSQDDASASEKTYLPLIQKQWQALLPFRSQIVERATASLRSTTLKGLNGSSEETTLAHTLLAILLLEPHSNPVQETLEIFLGQRTKALQATNIDTFGNTGRAPAISFGFGDGDDGRSRSRNVGGDGAGSSRFKPGHSRKDSRLNAAEVLRKLSPARRAVDNSAVGSARDGSGADQRKEKLKETRRIAEREKIAKAFMDSINLILKTEALSRAIFISNHGEPLMDRLIAQIQVDPTRRDAATLAAVNGESGVHDPLVSVATLLRTMPSSQILHAYLPKSIKGFVPYIGGDAASRSDASKSGIRGAGDLLDNWIKIAVRQLGSKATVWLQRANLVSDVWTVREKAFQSLKGLSDRDLALDDEQMKVLQESLDQTFNVRLGEIWQARLDALVATFEAGLDADIDKLSTNDHADNADFHPSSMFFSPIIFPTTRPLATVSTTAQLPDFRRELGLRLSQQTPLLAARLKQIERDAKAIKADLRCLTKARKQELLQQYTLAATSAIKRLCNALSDVAGKDESLSAYNTADLRVLLGLYLGRLALSLSTTSTAIPDLRLSGRADQSDCRKSFDQVYQQSLPPWIAMASKGALANAATLLESKASRTSSTDIGNALLLALQTLASDVMDSGIPVPYRQELQSQLARRFAEEARANILPNFSAERGDWKEGLEILSGKVETQSTDVYRKSQVLLSPMLSHIRPEGGKGSSNGTYDNRLARLLPFGAVPPGQDYVSPVPVVRPSARFGMLSVI